MPHTVTTVDGTEALHKQHHDNETLLSPLLERDTPQVRGVLFHHQNISKSLLNSCFLIPEIRKKQGLRMIMISGLVLQIRDAVKT